MITFNGKLFAKNDKELVNSLFKSRETAIGYYKILKNEVKFYTLRREYVCGVRHDGLPFSVSIIEGKNYYHHGFYRPFGDFFELSEDDCQRIGKLCKRHGKGV